MKNKMITSRDEDFAKWYTDVVRVAHLASYSDVKGFTIFEPNGYAIWENIQNILDRKFKRLGHQNVYMPLLIPESLLLKEASHVEGFAPECAWVTVGGQKELDEKMCIRPTSETLFCTYFKDRLKSHKDLPMLYNQWCSVVRWEKETRPFLRTREFLWQEGHTIHKTEEEAKSETLQMLNVYKDLYENYLAIPVLVGKKTEKEKFAGAEYTYTLEALMYNGVTLQSATSHYFGQKFTKPFDVKYADENNKLVYPYQTSWGLTTRTIGGIIMVHSDDNGLVLPPKIAPRQVVIIPIKNEENVVKIANSMCEELINAGITAFVDNTDRSAGFKFAEHETNGIPIRIEIGPKDIEEDVFVVTRRDITSKNKYRLSDKTSWVKVVKDEMESMQKDMYEKAKKHMEQRTYICKSMDEMENTIKTHPGFIKAMWCGDINCENLIKDKLSIKSRCIPFEEEHVDDKCVCCGKEAKHMVYWGIQY